MITPGKAWYAWSFGSMSVLIPKQRGSGWMKVPAGHDWSERITAVQAAGKCDVCGLDGTLDFDCGPHISTYPEKRAEFEARVLPVVAKWYRCKIGGEVGLKELCDAVLENNDG